MTRGTFVVFDHDYSGAELARLLGVVVTDVCRPLSAKFAPYIDRGRGNLSYIDKYVLDTKNETAVKIKTSAIRETNAEGSLASLFSLAGGWTASDEYELTSERITTVSIEQPDKALEDLMALHGEEIEELFRQPATEGSVYMLIGFKTASNPTITTGQTRSKIASLGASTQGIGGALGAPFADVKGKLGWRTTREILLESTVKDERAFAGEYLKLIWKAQGITILPGGKLHVKREIISKGVASFGVKKLAFGADDAEDEDEDEADDDILI